MALEKVSSVEVPKEDNVDTSPTAVVAANNDFLSAEEKYEAYATKTKTQVKLDPFQICLYPTLLSLPEDVLQTDLRHNLQNLVKTKLSEEYGEDFVYFAFTDAKIDWHTGEEEDSVCKSMLPASSPRNAEIDPCTCALYSGATVMLKNAGKSSSSSEATPEDLEPAIQQVVEENLVKALRNEPAPDDVRRRPFYTEVKGTNVSFSVAQRQNGGKLVFVSDPENEGQQLVESGDNTESSEQEGAAILDESLQDSTVVDVIGVNALEESKSQQSASGFSSTTGKILASVIGGVLLVVLVVLFFVLRKSKKLRKEAERQRGQKDNSTVISDHYDRDLVDEEIATGGRRRGTKKQHRRNPSNSSMDDESEAAQYHRSGNLLDSVSLASEWTLTTGVTDGTMNNRNKSMAEMLAAKETFDRDRQVTLQKDMLQPQWAVVPPSGLALARTDSLALADRLPTTPTRNRRNNENALQFEEAGGQGEEIYLMQH